MARTIEDDVSELNELLCDVESARDYYEAQLTALIALCENVVDADSAIGGADHHLGDAIEALHDWLTRNNPDRQG